MGQLLKKRVYEEAEPKDGYRIFVDRLWPRGVKKEAFPYDEWAKDITPSHGIRKAFNHETEKFATFKINYLQELTENENGAKFVETVRSQLKKQNVTLLYAAKDTETNHVVLLIDWLKDQLESEETDEN